MKSVNLSGTSSKAPKKGVVLVNTRKKVSINKKSVRINYSPDDVVNALKAVDAEKSCCSMRSAYCYAFQKKRKP